MGRWIVVHGQSSRKQTLINLDNVDAIQGSTISFTGGNNEDYLVVSESFDDLIKLIVSAEVET